MKTLILILLVSIIYANDYTKLKLFKKDNPSISQEQLQGDILVRFKNINKFNFYEFENKV